MEKVMQVETLSMGWCLDCHSDPADHIRPLRLITDMLWQTSADQQSAARTFMADLEISPPIDCSGCHR